MTLSDHQLRQEPVFGAELVVRLEGTDVVLAVVGELDARTAAMLESVLAERISHGARRFVIDLEATTSVDPSSTAALITGSRRARAANGDLVVRALPGTETFRAVERCGLTSLLTGEA